MRFDDAWPRADEVPGWLTRAQGELLWTSTLESGPHPHVLEVGSHEGRSTVLLALAVTEAAGRLTAVDPFDPGWRYGTPGTETRLRERLHRTGAADRTQVLVERSGDLRATWSEPLSLVYVDGAHDYRSARDDLGWAQHLPHGGRLLLHDAFSSVGVTLAVLLHVLPGTELAYAGRRGSMAVLEHRRPSPGDRARVLRELPWFARNVVVKVLLRLRLRPVARLLGHTDVHDPY